MHRTVRPSLTPDAMIFAFATDDKTLMAFPDERAAISYCEGWDVAANGWHFFAANGCPMEPIFSEPASVSGWVISHGRYSLRPMAATEENSLLALLPNIAAVEGQAPLNTVAAIEKLLTAHTSAQMNR